MQGLLKFSYEVAIKHYQQNPIRSLTTAEKYVLSTSDTQVAIQRAGLVKKVEGERKLD